MQQISWLESSHMIWNSSYYSITLHLVYVLLQHACVWLVGKTYDKGGNIDDSRDFPAPLLSYQQRPFSPFGPEFRPSLKLQQVSCEHVSKHSWLIIRSHGFLDLPVKNIEYGLFAISPCTYIILGVRTFISTKPASRMRFSKWSPLRKWLWNVLVCISLSLQLVNQEREESNLQAAASGGTLPSSQRRRQNSQNWIQPFPGLRMR